MTTESDDSRSSDGPPAEALLAARLRRASPELEARFEGLQRRLAAGSRQRWRLLAFFHGWVAVASAAAASAALLVIVRSSSGPRAAPFDAEAFGELLALDQALRPALPLTDPESRSVILEMPAAQK